MPLVSFSSGQVIKSADVNANFGICMLTDTSRTISVTHTYNGTQTFTGGWTAGAACSVSTGGFTVTAGGITVTAGGLTVTAGGLTVSASGITVTGNSNITGTLGSLTGITSSGTAAFAAMTASTTIAVTGYSSLIGGAKIGGATLATGALMVKQMFSDSSARGFALESFGNDSRMEIYFNGSDWVHDPIFSSTGAYHDQIFMRSATERLRVSANGITVTGSLTMATAAGKIIPGATSLTFRNNADTQDNVAIVDAGDVTIGRGNLTLSLGNFIITGVAGTVQIGGNQVVGPRLTGYTNAWTGAAANNATGYDASTITLPQLAARVRALQESITSHGLIGV